MCAKKSIQARFLDKALGPSGNSIPPRAARAMSRRFPDGFFSCPQKT
jgi:hypothetical protein